MDKRKIENNEKENGKDMVIFHNVDYLGKRLIIDDFMWYMNSGFGVKVNSIDGCGSIHFWGDVTQKDIDDIQRTAKEQKLGRFIFLDMEHFVKSLKCFFEFFNDIDENAFGWVRMDLTDRGDGLNKKSEINLIDLFAKNQKVEDWKELINPKSKKYCKILDDFMKENTIQNNENLEMEKN